MYSEEDLSSAIDAGVMTKDTAQAFREHIANNRTSPIVLVFL